MIDLICLKYHYNILLVPDVLVDLIELYNEYDINEELTNSKYKNHLRYLVKLINVK